MVKCPARMELPGGGRVRCHRLLSECLRDWCHTGTRYAGSPRKPTSYAWRWKPSDEALAGQDWQLKIKAEVRRLGWACKDASETRNPRLYNVFKTQRAFVAGFAVKERRNRYGIVTRVRKGPDGIVLPVGQDTLGSFTE